MPRRKKKNKGEAKIMEKLPPEEPPYEKGWLQGEFVILKLSEQDPAIDVTLTTGILLDGIICVTHVCSPSANLHVYEILTSAKRTVKVVNERPMKEFMDFLFPSEFSQEDGSDDEGLI